MTIYIDLHAHSNHSDGLWSVIDLLSVADKKGLKGFSITDHDTISGSLEAQKNKKLFQGKLIPGIEIETEINNNIVHLLAYFPDLNFPKKCSLLKTLQRIRNDRIFRMKKMITKINDLNMIVNLEEVIFEATKTEGLLNGTKILSRPHLARILVQKKYVKSTTEAFELYLGENKSCYVPRYNPSIKIWKAHIKQLGGIIIWAHPLGTIDKNLENLNTLSTGLSGIIDGVERYYNYFSMDSSFKSQGNMILDEFIYSEDWIITAGGDFHGDKGEITKFEISKSKWKEFLDLLY